MQAIACNNGKEAGLKEERKEEKSSDAGGEFRTGCVAF